MTRALEIDERRWFQVVEIEINHRCNLRCSYCPQSLDWFRQPEHRMEFTLFRHIIAQLSELDFAGRLSFHMYNEPLLHPKLNYLVSYARAAVSNAWLVLYTNGDLLDDRKYLELLDAGIDSFLVTRHSGLPMLSRPFQTVRFPSEFMMSSRGGLVKKGKETNLACFAPSEMLMIHHDGSVVICHEDAASRNVMGHTDRQRLRDIWFSEKFMFYRRVLKTGNRRKAGGICATCDNRLHPLPDTAI